MHTYMQNTYMHTYTHAHTLRIENLVTVETKRTEVTEMQTIQK